VEQGVLEKHHLLAFRAIYCELSRINAAEIVVCHDLCGIGSAPQRPS
jgi:hypothetical protein